MMNPAAVILWVVLMQQDPKPSLEEFLRSFYKNMQSTVEEEQLKTVRSVFATRKDLEILFPKDVETLWPLLDEVQQELEKHLAEVTKELQKGGAVTGVKAINIRKDPEAETYKEVLAMIPKDIPAFDYVVTKEKGSSGGGTYLYVQNRWIFLRGLSGIPKFLKRQK